jgi:hypothetical protein
VREEEHHVRPNSKEKHKAYMKNYRMFDTYTEILAVCCMYRIFVKIYCYNQPQYDPTIISAENISTNLHLRTRQ